MDMVPEIRLTVGVYDDLPDDIYHGDCCEGPSVSSTGLRQVLRDPASYWEQSPMNPDVKAAKASALADALARGEAPKKRHFDKGRSAHLLLLEPGRVLDQVSVIPEDLLGANGALSTKAAKEFAGVQAALGRAVLKPDEWEDICDCADALSDHPDIRGLVAGYAIEQSHIMMDAETGIYIKSRPDLTPPESGRWIVDYKTTEVESIEQWETKSMADFGLNIQAALQLWAAHDVAGIESPGVCYIVQNIKTKRVALRYFGLDDDAEHGLMTAARLDLRRAINTFAECFKNQCWPSPWDEPAHIQAPDWLKRSTERRLADNVISFPGVYAA